MTVHPAKTQISLGIPQVWSKSSLSAWRKLGSLTTHWAHSLAGRTVILLVLSYRGSNYPATGMFFRAHLLPNNKASFLVIWIKLAASWENLTYSMPYANNKGADQPAQYTIQTANNKGIDQPARMICTFVVRIWHKHVFSWRGSYNTYTHAKSKISRL